jgi:RNA polymerase sigma-70 factor, ECF subfamily
VCADQVRRRQRQRRLFERVSRLTDVEDRSPSTGDHSSDLLSVLDPDRREAFVLTQLIGLSYEEAAAVADCAIGTIRSRVARARAELVEAVRVAEAR